MSGQVEDLYLKGFMAFSAKKFAEAKAYWEQVLTVDPNHEQAKKGLADLGRLKPKKRTAKEILQEIKRLYNEKEYNESLRLCQMLVNKYPDNQDLQGLKTRIENRISQIQATPGAAPKAPPTDGDMDLESTMYYTKQAEALVEQDAPAPVAPPAAAAPAPEQTPTKSVEALIQEGVSHYELQDYPRALSTWEEALSLEPDNRIVRDYIANVRAMVEQFKPAATEAPAPQPSVEAKSEPPQRPSKDQLLEAYNKGLKHYQNKSYDEAMGQWEYILKFHPNHKETLQCLEKTRQAIAKVAEQKVTLEKAKKALASGNHTEAESMATKLNIEAPNLDGLDTLNVAIEERKRQINEIRSLEIVDESATDIHFSPSDEEITRYFTPEEEGKPVEARQVTKVVQVKRNKKPMSKWLTMALPIGLVVLGIGGYVGWDFYQRQLRSSPVNVALTIPVQEPDWNSSLQKAEDFTVLGEEFVAEGQVLLANFALKKASAIAEARLKEISGQSESIGTVTETNRLSEILREFNARKDALANGLTPPKKDEEILTKARNDLRRDKFETAIPAMLEALSTSEEDTTLANEIGQAYHKLALEKMKQGQLDAARINFRNAATLQQGYEMSRRHMEVIRRFFHGDIDAREKDQWFFFFVD